MRITLLLVSPLVASGFFVGPAGRAAPASTVVSRRASGFALEEACASRSRHTMWRLAMSEVEAEAAAPAAEEGSEEAGDKPAGKGRGKRTPLSGLSVGQELQGKVKGIKDFGVFVDIGAESDGLVHISQMSASFVSNPSDLAKVGDSVTVRVLSVDADKRQIALTMKSEAESAAGAARPKKGGRQQARAQRDDDDEEEDAGDEGDDVLKDAPVGDKDVSAFAEFDPKKFLGGKVASVQAYGAFIRLDDADIDGLLPTGDMDGKLEVGQRVQVRITDVDTERNRITLSNLPLLRGKRTRFAMNKEDTDELERVARRSGLYASELPETFEGPDDDADWEAAFAFKGFGDAEGLEGVVAEEETEGVLFGEEPEEDDEEFSMGSINVFRSPAWKREKGLMTEAEEEDAEAGFKYGGEAYFPEDDDDGDATAVGDAYTQNYETQIPQLSEEELKALIKKAQGTRRNVEEEWAEEVAEEKEYMTVNFAASKKQGKGLVMQALNAASAEDALKKPRMPIYFSKKLSPVKQVELLEELEKLVSDDPLALAK